MDLKATREALTHPGLRGAAFEASFRSFLRTYLPRTLDISTGVLVDSEGRQSRQLDVIISDALKTPVFYSVGETRVIPVECAYMVFEVKANLDSAALDACLTNMLSVRELKKKAYMPPNGPLTKKVRAYGDTWEIYPVNYFVFAFDSSNLWTIGEQYLNAIVQHHLIPSRRIDSICVLERGVITNRLSAASVDALPQNGSAIQICETGDALLLFYALLSKYFNQMWLPDFRFVDYLSDMEFGVNPKTGLD